MNYEKEYIKNRFNDFRNRDFGVAIGTVIDFAANNIVICMCFGISIGMCIGIAIGSSIKKNEKNNIK